MKCNIPLLFLCLTFLLLPVDSKNSSSNTFPIRTTSTGIQFVRTPESRFKSIPNYPAPPQYVTISGLRMAYIDVGYAIKGTFLLLHGEPDWGYLYNRMIPILVRAGYRVIVPDFIGFGRSDKPISQNDYTYNSHVLWMKQFMTSLNLQSVHAFMQDWGGLIGLTIAADEPFRFDRLVLANTAIPNGTTSKLFLDWQKFAQQVPVFDPGMILQSASVRNISKEELDAYRAPFPTELFKAGARKFPLLVPVTPSDPSTKKFLRVRETLKANWTKPVLMQWGLQDYLAGSDVFEDFNNIFSGAKGQPHQLYPNAHHFIQEDVSEYLADAIVRWLEMSTGQTCMS